jgi:transposase-like protein
VSQTCRFFGISRSLFYIWRDRYRQDGLIGLRDGPRGPRHHPFTTPAHVIALILQVRRQRQYGPLRISLFLQRYHQVYVSPPTIQRILKRHRVPRVSLKRYRPGPRRRREIPIPGQSVQVDVKHLKLGGRRFYQFTAIDEAARYRVLRVYAHNSIKSATEFVDEVRRRLPIAKQRNQTHTGNNKHPEIACPSDHKD